MYLVCLLVGLWIIRSQTARPIIMIIHCTQRGIYWSTVCFQKLLSCKPQFKIKVAYAKIKVYVYVANNQRCKFLNFILFANKWQDIIFSKNPYFYILLQCYPPNWIRKKDFLNSIFFQKLRKKNTQIIVQFFKNLHFA